MILTNRNHKLLLSCRFVRVFTSHLLFSILLFPCESLSFQFSERDLLESPTDAQAETRDKMSDVVLSYAAQMEHLCFGMISIRRAVCKDLI